MAIATNLRIIDGTQRPNSSAVTPRHGDKSIFRYKDNDTLRAWRLDLQAAIREEHAAMSRAKKGSVLWENHWRALKLYAGQCSRITCILRDRWEE